ncbi:2-dehydro-3-deoxy-D-gluconate 5-dehydrogenase KduD [Tessaracoccus oleiagri]|uniref:2-deoxy-D-gluconate 3-dehydrogenase n=1 Tax=Tessaracoccus oleiagri TaxID=686624 RepID=A0A1G9N208_9ACTN|nr:2-dehydro-3-deoxy-D-gluconate 5-dehydrogenase KduD [Tessaracoccus oleiagri]SDL80414.1 2-deoxy-D-gluconate 3-dehydrogenase [Tessaracoccus oleiagri]
MILDSFRLDGRVALVTGATRGLGEAMAEALAEAGADVALVGSSSPPDTTAEAVRGLGRRALTLVCDLASAGPEELEALVRRTTDEFGRLDILVNNAGIIRRTPALELGEADWDDVVQVNQKSAFFLAQAAGRVMAEAGGGRIINTASLLSHQGGINVASYTASKHAVAGLTRALANEWAPLGINVNAIVPGYFATDNTAALRADPERSRSILERIPAGRWGEADDLKGAALFLASPASAYVTGTLLAVDGGWLAR